MFNWEIWSKTLITMSGLLTLGVLGISYFRYLGVLAKYEAENGRRQK